MFGIGFSEYVVIALLALIVLGPEKLPRVAAQVGKWIGRARSMARKFREQLEDEIHLAETNKPKPASTASAEPTGTADDTASAATSSTTAEPAPGMYSSVSEPGHTSAAPASDAATTSPEVAAANAAAETAHSDSNGPAPAPEAAEYTPPLYSQTAATETQGGGHETHAGTSDTSNGAAHGGKPSAAHPSTVESASHHEEPPLKAGDFITQTHERGI